MEHSTSAVNWQPRNVAKPAGQLIRDSLGHVARGSEGAMFFQWRASRAGAEKWHSAMVPHAGTDTRIWRDVVTLGGHLGRLAEVEGSTVECEVAVLLDYPSGWAQEASGQPSADLTAFAEIRRWHAALWRAGITADVTHPGADLSGYRLVLAPTLYAVEDGIATQLATFVAAGGTLVIGPYSGVVDEHDHVRLGGYPGAFTELLGVRVEEFHPLREGESVRLTIGATGRVWTESARETTATVVARYADGPAEGHPAVTRRTTGAGTAWYVGTRLDDQSLAALLDRWHTESGARPVIPGGPPLGVETVRRRHPDGRSYLFLLNHSGDPAVIPAVGTDLLTGTQWTEPTTLPAGGVAVIASPAQPSSEWPEEVS